MKKCFLSLSLLLMMFCILPLAGSAESPAGDMAAEVSDRGSPYAGINARFTIQDRFFPTEQHSESVVSEQPSGSSSTDAVVKESTKAEDIELIDTMVETYGQYGNEKLVDSVLLQDGGFLLVGCADLSIDDQQDTQQGAWALRFSASGEKLWEYTHHVKETIGYFDMVKENADGTILLHYANSLFNLFNHSLVTLSADGELLDESPMSSLVYKVYRATDGIIVDSGSSLTKYNEDLVIQYELEDAALSHMEFLTQDGRFFYGYLLREQSRLGDAVVFMLNDNGDILWDAILQPNARFEGCVQLSDGDYLCTGYMDNDMGRESGLAARISPDGEVRYVLEYSRDGEHFFISHAYELQNGALLVGGSNKQNHIFLIAVDEDGNELQRYSMPLGRRVELTSTPLRVIETSEDLFVVGDLVFYRTLLSPEDADFFVLPLHLPENLQ